MYEAHLAHNLGPLLGRRLISTGVVCMCMYVRMYVCMHVCMYVLMYVRM